MRNEPSNTPMIKCYQPERGATKSRKSPRFDHRPSGTSILPPVVGELSGPKVFHQLGQRRRHANATYNHVQRNSGRMLKEAERGLEV
jgi:hypothetical protein